MSWTLWARWNSDGVALTVNDWLFNYFIVFGLSGGSLSYLAARLCK